MKISVITLFPAVFDPILNSSMLKIAQTKSKISFELINLRDFGKGTHQVVDGRPYSGGPGMVLRADILSAALKKCKVPGTKCQVVLTSASGKPYKQADAQRLSKIDHLIVICGHYEGVDQRFIDKYVDEEISIGDYVLTGGEIPAMVIIDSITRLIPGVLNKDDATAKESFSIQDAHNHSQLVEYPQYTRPDTFEGESVPEILLSGNHQKIADWQMAQSIAKTKKVRPDLLK